MLFNVLNNLHIHNLHAYTVHILKIEDTCAVFNWTDQKSCEKWGCYNKK